jgi:hypothetical protein
MHYKVGFIFSGNREEKEDWISTPNKLDSESNSGHLSYPLVTYHKYFHLSMPAVCPLSFPQVSSLILASNSEREIL